MTEYPYTVVDAFTDKPFAGNPAAVMVVDEFFSDEMLLKIAIEHNLSETAFLVRLAEDHYRLRWFTRAPRFLCVVTPRWHRALLSLKNMGCKRMRSASRRCRVH